MIHNGEIKSQFEHSSSHRSTRTRSGEIINANIFNAKIVDEQIISNVSCRIIVVAVAALVIL